MSAAFKVIFKNENFIAVEKPAGWLTVPSRYEEKDQRPCLGRDLELEHGAIWPVHRLDFEVSGLVLFARNAKAHSASNGWFEHGHVRKTYLALSFRQDFSHWPAKILHSPDIIDAQAELEFDWECRIEKGKRRAFESPRGKQAQTKAKILDTIQEICLWQLNPLTGRSHQLRFEMSRHGFPILGDLLYGGKAQGKSNEIALRSVSINLDKISSSERFGLPSMLNCQDENYLKNTFLKVEP